ncbi:MAG: hypothetical protein GX639_03170 [Fibrobacter sp.]|nr:hypothetical protein [Fibrobacter sp.]
MNKQYPDLKKTLADRKEKMIQLYMRYKEMQGSIDRSKPVTSNARCGRNDPCYCGSGKKFKKCCGK